MERMNTLYDPFIFLLKEQANLSLKLEDPGLNKSGAEALFAKYKSFEDQIFLELPKLISLNLFVIDNQ